jgi:hypothetical protein
MGKGVDNEERAHKSELYWEFASSLISLGRSHVTFTDTEY